MSELISIIIPTYNRAFLIKETIESIRKQTYSNWECLIIDGNSTDNSEYIIPTYFDLDTRFSYYRVNDSDKKGPNYLRNFGFNKAKGRFIYFFDSDDILKPYALKTYISNFNENIDVVVAPLEKVNMATGKLLEKNKVKSDNLIIDYFIGNISFYVCGPLWRKSFLVQQEALFDENIQNLDDFDFNLRMIYAKPKIEFLDITLVTYNQHQNSLKKEIMKLNREEIESAFLARNKHLHLLKEKKFDKINVVEEIINEHRKEILRRALINSDVLYFRILIDILCYYIRKFKILHLIKIISGVILFRFFKKGYNLLK